MAESPKSAPKSAVGRATTSRQGGARAASRTTPPPRKPGSRAQAIFAILGLLVIFTMIFGLVAIGFRGFGLGSDDEDTTDQDPTSKLVPTYEAKLQQDPNDFNTMLILANILQNRAEFPEAISWYQKAVELQPNNVDARLAFGQCLASYGQLYDAEAQYKKVLELDSKNVKAEYYLGELYKRWNPPRTEEAKIHYARASELEPEGSYGRAARDALNQLNATPTPATPTP
jgi:cytochrome c-type biogenesis protein CcmH/NrfG